jgi:nicotinamide phosphoribosyltransferase
LHSDRETFEFVYNNVFYKFDGEYLQDLFDEYGEETSYHTSTILDLIKHNVASPLKKQPNIPELKGVIELLWDVFGGTVNEQGYKVLDPHIGAIYGDSITIERADEICRRLEAKGFASTNVVLGIGSFTYQYNTRDTFGFAMKATYVEVDGEGREIFKDPITDDGTKKSATGLLKVVKTENGYVLVDKVSSEDERDGELQTIYEDGKFYNQTTLAEIRKKLM